MRATHARATPARARHLTAWGLVCLAQLGVVACQGDPPPSEEAGDEARSLPQIDEALLGDLLGEAVSAEGDRVSADGLLVRLAFEPLIRQTGPVQIQLVQSQGYRLSGVAVGSPLWQLGLREGDVLVTVDGQAIIGREHELRSSWEARPSAAEIGYRRGGEDRVLHLDVRPGHAWRNKDMHDEIARRAKLEARRAKLEARRAEREAARSAHLGLPEGSSEDALDTRPPSSLLGSSEAIELISAGLRCVAAKKAGGLASCELTRVAMERILSNPAFLSRQARVVPAVRDGQTKGYKLYGIRPSSLPVGLGLKNGDLISSINGIDLDSLDTVMALYGKLRQASNFSIGIERKGEQMELSLEIVDELSGPPASLPSSALGD